MGIILWVIFNNPVSYELRYDDQCNSNTVCRFNITINKNIPKPAYVFLKIENFFLNHRLILNSFSPDQLQGADITEAKAKSDCGNYYNNQNGGKTTSVDGSPLNQNGIMNPCGWKAFLYFKDEFNIKLASTNTNLNILTTGLISETYKNNKYTNNKNINKVQWINYQDEFFLQWMQTPIFKNFERLYGRLDNGLNIGNYVLEIKSNSKEILKSIKKSIVIKNLTFLGGKNLNLVYAHMITSSLLFMSALILIIFENNSKNN